MSLAQDAVAAPPRRPALARLVPWLALAALVLLPLVLEATGEGYFIRVVTRGLIYAIAAMALQFVLGTGGLVSFGFAAFMGIGAYAVGIPYAHGVEEGLIVFPLAVVASALFGLATGAIALRTHGVYFIMITLAFGQMAYYFATSLSGYGGDDGLTLWDRTSFLGWPALEGRFAYYWICLGCAAGTWALIRGLQRGPFGRALDGARRNEARMRALGFDVWRARLFAYALAGALGGLAGALIANQAEFVSPAYMSWHRSGELIVMVVLGGVMSLSGAGAGAVLLVIFEEVAAEHTDRWPILLGLVVLAIAIWARRGLAGLFERRR